MTHDHKRDDPRVQQIADWLLGELKFKLVRLEPASNDASFRRYFRVWRADGASRIVMDAPPEKESTAAFLKVARLLAACQVHVPEIDAVERARGFVLMEDLGSVHYLERLRAGADADALYADALGSLRRIQLQGREAARELPPYDRAALMAEMQLMPEWFCARHLQLALEAPERALLEASFELLARACLAQPVVFVHRDYHSRNLMCLPARSPGIVDFQDALAGPIGYDLVSLLKDCYIDWPRARVESWVRSYHGSLQTAGAATGADAHEFLRWFDLVGLQRHIKVLGIFARLWFRDGKSGYLADLPRTLQYVRATVVLYPEFAEFAAWLERRVVPAFPVSNQRALSQARTELGGAEGLSGSAAGAA
jgi:aminoglycoside/choline kinase family phosphotransferase